MSYTSNIPLSGESLGSTRDRINQNFQQIDTVLAVNHVAFNDSGEGKHTFLQMPEQASAPATAVNEGGFYTKVVSGNTQFFMRNESSGSEYQISGMNDASFARFGAQTEYSAGPPSLKGGWTFLPGGLILQYGIYDTQQSATSFAITFPRSFPTNVYNVVITGFRAATSPGNTDAWVSTTGFTTAGFTIYNNGGHAFKFMWQAIGN